MLSLFRLMLTPLRTTIADRWLAEGQYVSGATLMQRVWTKGME